MKSLRAAISSFTTIPRKVKVMAQKKKKKKKKLERKRKISLSFNVLYAI